MKILIISRNTWPQQSPRAFRTQELSEELARRGHDVTLYTVHGDFDYTEYERITGVKMCDINPRLPIRGNDGKNRYNLFTRFIYHYFHRLLLFPEVEFHFKVDSILQKEKDIDLLITIALPHTIHSGAARSKKKHPKFFPKVWIADCGDPFFLNPFFNVPKYVEKYERSWCQACDYITVPTAASKEGYFTEYRDKIRVIPQGFNFSKTPISVYEKNTIPTFVFAGTVHAGRSPERFMDFLLKQSSDYRFYLYMHKPLDSKYETLSNGRIKYMIGYGRNEIIKACSKADFLINVKNPSIVQTPSKLIDYGIAGRPILEVSNDFNEEVEFNEFLHDDYSSQLIVNNLDLYKIERVALQFLALANNG